MNPSPFDIKAVYREEVANLLSSRKKSQLIHSSADIDASGDEVEVPFREFLKRRLPNQYFVGHGHIVDKFLNVSPQFDVIIADSHATPILFEAENGTQYFPWESVFAVGEVKASYQRGKHQVRTFADNVARLKNQLVRLPTPANYLGNGVFLGEGIQLMDNRKLRNPLFSFMVFFSSGSMTRDALAAEYNGASDENLPVIASFLDGKVVAKAGLQKVEEGVAMGPIDPDPLRIVERKDLHWMQMNYESESEAGAHALVVLMLGLFDHLNRCKLMPPSIHEYLKAFEETGANQPLPLSLTALVEAWRLSGTTVPCAFVKWLEQRVARGKSPFKKVSAKEVVEFLEETGIPEDEFIRSLGLAEPCASPNGGPGTMLSHSGAVERPPSVS